MQRLNLLFKQPVGLEMEVGGRERGKEGRKEIEPAQTA